MPVRPVGWKNGSESLGMFVGGEWEGVSLTSDEKVGWKLLESKSASNLLKRSDHLLSRSAILVSVEDESDTFLGFEETFSFLALFS